MLKLLKDDDNCVGRGWKKEKNTKEMTFSLKDNLTVFIVSSLHFTLLSSLYGLHGGIYKRIERAFKITF